MNHFLKLIVLLIIVCSCKESNKTFVVSEISILPKPVSLTLGQESYAVNANSTISIDNEAQKPAANFLFDLCEDATILDLPLEFNLKTPSSMIFKGYFMAENEGIYKFATKSDDGNLLYIVDKLVVDNSGNYSAIARDSIVALTKGWHPIKVDGGNELTV